MLFQPSSDNNQINEMQDNMTKQETGKVVLILTDGTNSNFPKVFKV